MPDNESTESAPESAEQPTRTETVIQKTTAHQVETTTPPAEETPAAED